MLLGREPEDYDIVTTAPPEQVPGVATFNGWQAKEPARLWRDDGHHPG